MRSNDGLMRQNQVHTCTNHSRPNSNQPSGRSMSSKQPETIIGRAEQAFWDAFERLKKGKPRLVPKGTKVTQNNIAREVGVDPSALRKSRFPKLVVAIQQWIDENPVQSTKSPRQMALAGRAATRDLRATIELLKTQRDDALATLVEAEARIVELTIENTRLLALAPKTQLTVLNGRERGKSVGKPVSG